MHDNSPSWSKTFSNSPRTMTMSWTMRTKEDLLINMDALHFMVRTTKASFSGLPGWETLFHIEANFKSLELKLWLWPEPLKE